MDASAIVATVLAVVISAVRIWYAYYEHKKQKREFEEIEQRLKNIRQAFKQSTEVTEDAEFEIIEPKRLEK